MIDLVGFSQRKGYLSCPDAGAYDAGQETILVLEDDPAVMGVVRATLETDYRVLEAESASQALEIFYRVPAEIHLVLTDQTLRDGTGQEVVKQLKVSGETFRSYISRVMRS